MQSHPWLGVVIHELSSLKHTVTTIVVKIILYHILYIYHIIYIIIYHILLQL